MKSPLDNLIPVYDAQQDKILSMHAGRAIFCMTNYPDRFMSQKPKASQGVIKMPKAKTATKKPAKGKSNYERIVKGGSRKKGVQNFAELMPEATHKRFDEMIDETIYIVKIEQQHSDNYGDGFKVYFKDVPNARDTYTAACYGAYVVPQLQSLYDITNQGARISLDSPVRTTIRKAGNTYKFE